MCLGFFFKEPGPMVKVNIVMIGKIVLEYAKARLSCSKTSLKIKGPKVGAVSTQHRENNSKPSNGPSFFLKVLSVTCRRIPHRPFSAL